MPETLANKIAAGEVVQRPASVLKELIENALDAGASDIAVHLKAAGSDLVQVVDNGSGMSPSDAAACFQRHATSKIRSVEDLNRLQTLGFRGEALASIAAVARVTLKTKRSGEDAGTLVRVDGGEVVKQQPCATPAGTSIAVRSLFYNVPARRNFLKKPATELKHLVETFQFLALANPRVAFSLEHKGNEMYRLPAPQAGSESEGDLTRRIEGLFGDSYAAHLVEVAQEASYLAVHGLVGTPEFTRRSRGEQFLFVNGRYVKSRYLSHAVKTAYSDMLPDGAFPFFALFLEIDPSHVDFNVHPTKSEVKFDDESGVYGFLRGAVKEALGTQHVTPQVDRPSPDRTEGAPSFSTSKGQVKSFDPGPSRKSKPSSPTTPLPSHGSSRSSKKAPEEPGALSAELYRGKPEAVEEEEAEGKTLLWQVQGRYVLTETPSGLMLVDQQAAHARVLYEQACRHLEGETGPSQQLMFPVTVDLNPADHALLEELLPDLRKLGFELEMLSGRSVAVRGLPAEVRSAESESAMLEDILEQYKANRDAPRVKGRKQLARSLARRGSITPGTPLEPVAMQALVEQLFACEMPYASPTGQPTIVKIPVEELDKRFEK